MTFVLLTKGSSYAGGQWAAGDEPLYYIVSPKDVVIAKPRLVFMLPFFLQNGFTSKHPSNWCIQPDWKEDKAILSAFSILEGHVSCEDIL